MGLEYFCIWDSDMKICAYINPCTKALSGGLAVNGLKQAGLQNSLRKRYKTKTIYELGQLERGYTGKFFFSQPRNIKRER